MPLYFDGPSNSGNSQRLSHEGLNCSRYVGNSPTNYTDPTGLDRIPIAPKVDANKETTFEIKPYGVVKVSVAATKGAVAKQTNRSGIYLKFERDPNYEKDKCPQFAWTQHVVHFDVQEGKRVFAQSPRYDNATTQIPGRTMGAESKPAGPFLNELDRPKTGPWNENPWYGGYGAPDGSVPEGHTNAHPLPQSSIFDVPQSDVGQGVPEEYIAQLICTTTKNPTPIFTYYYYVDNGEFHGMKMLLDGVAKIQIAK